MIYAQFRVSTSKLVENTAKTISWLMAEVSLEPISYDTKLRVEDFQQRTVWCSRLRRFTLQREVAGSSHGVGGKNLIFL